MLCCAGNRQRISAAVILSLVVFQAERRISHTSAPDEREIPRPAGKGAGLRDDLPQGEIRVNPRLSVATKFLAEVRGRKSEV